MMIDSLSIAVLLFGLIVTAPAYAGTVSVTDGHGTWQSTDCTPPKSPSVLSNNPEEEANDLNEQMAQYNDYVAKSQQYMDCVSKEGKTDAEVSNQIIVNSAQAIIKQTQEEVKNAIPTRKE